MMLTILAAWLAASSVFGVGLPYEARVVANANLAAAWPVRGLLSEDLDGDGVNEWVSGCSMGVLFRSWKDGASYSDYQYNLPPRFLVPRAMARLGAACDVDGDGWREVLVCVRSADGWEQRLLAIDPHRDEPVRDIELTSGPEVREDGVWDAEYLVLGVAAGDSGPVVYLSRKVGYDRRNRGVLAIDLATGTELWFHPTASIVSNGCIADPDGDGEPELVVGLGASANQRPGDEVDGRLDDVSWVAVLETDGSLLWERRLAPYFADVFVAVCDLDGDGGVEVAVLNQCTRQGSISTLMILDGPSGSERGSVVCSGVPRGLQTWYDSDRGVGVIVVGCEDRTMTRYEWRGGILRPERRREFQGPVVSFLQADVMSMPGPELYVLCADQRVYALDRDLRDVAHCPPAIDKFFDVLIWRLGPDSILAYENRLNAGFRFVPVPAHRRYAGVAGAGSLVLLVGAGGGHLLRQRRRLGALRRTSRLDLLRAFLTSRHGTVGPVGALERVLWAAENPHSVPPERLAGSWEAFRREGWPDLEALLEKAAHMRLDPPLLTVVRREAGACLRHLDRAVDLEPGGRERAEAVAAARTSFGVVADGMKLLGAGLAASCRIDVRPVVREVLERHVQRRPAVAFRLEPLADDLPDVHADRLDLEFALDNLLDNAGRAVQGRPAAVVTVSVTPGPAGRLGVTVQDNGPGVPEADRERIFAQGASSRPGGGVGLWHSRDALRYYGGDITVGEAVGGGARFSLVLRTAGA
ncbi:MAG TPA: HAMP domain-containing sensor histidine kinase [Candidatus Krumholzibacteria bacterium]|nr:HAMP domain-containing sensor histidine kinase [Candidatus Krumholzibacteria bacterium]